MKISKLIIKLADNELSAHEREKLEKELYNNPKLMKEYQTHLQLNEFLKKEFKQDMLKEDKKKASPQDKSLEAEMEAIEKDVFRSTIDLVKEWKEEKRDSKYSDELKEFASLGIKARKKKEKQAQNSNVDEKSTLTRKVLSLNRLYFIAASVAAFIVISVVVFNYLKSPADNGELFASYYQPYHFITEQTRSYDLTEDSLTNVATELYQKKKYKEASELAAKVLAVNDKHVKARFLYGLIQLETENYLGAVKEFKTILTNYDSYHLESRWYLALCYLKLEKTTEAKELLNVLGQSKNFYQKRAVELLKEME